jgi:hypothetical protein
MFCITARTCRTFTLQEILILAAMNVETIRQASAGGMRRKTAGTKRGCLSASHLVRIRVRKARQM